MKFLLSLFVAVILVVGIAQAETPSSRAFTEAAAAAARAAMPSAQVTVNGDLHLETRSAAGEEITTDLHNAYETYLRVPVVGAAVRGRPLRARPQAPPHRPRQADHEPIAPGPSPCL